MVKNQLNDFDHVPSDLMAEGASREHPLVTITIPTFKRFGLLVEAVQSALAQNFNRPYEIVVIDNDPGSKNAESLLERLPELKERSFRYFVNRENIGMFPNHNRCIQLARGEWMTILNDDDLLDDDYLTAMFSVLDHTPEIDGLVSRKRALHQHKHIEERRSSFSRRAAKRLLLELLFASRPTRPINVHKFFWGAILGNVTGFIFRTRTARAVGGFYAENSLNADLWFFARFANTGNLHQHRAFAATVRIAENEMAKLTTLKTNLEHTLKLQQALVGTEVPKWWRHFSPLIMERDRSDAKTYWNLDFPKPKAEELLKLRLPTHRPFLLWIARILLRGF